MQKHSYFHDWWRLNYNDRVSIDGDWIVVTDRGRGANTCFQNEHCGEAGLCNNKWCEGENGWCCNQWDEKCSQVRIQFVFG